MTPWCDDFVCSWRRLLADRHSLPFTWTLSLHRLWCPSASHHPLTFLFLLALTFPLPSPFPSLGLSLCRPPCPSASPQSFPSISLGRLCQRTKGGGGGVAGALWSPGDASCQPGGGGGGMAVLAPGASHRPGGRALPLPPSTESRILAQALAGALHPPAVVARRRPVGGGREG